MISRQSLSWKLSSLVLVCIVFAPIGARRAASQAPPHQKPRTAAKPTKTSKAGQSKTESSGESGPNAVLQRHFDAAQAAEESGNLIVAESEYRQALGFSLGILGQTYQTLGDL